MKINAKPMVIKWVAKPVAMASPFGTPSATRSRVQKDSIVPKPPGLWIGGWRKWRTRW